MRCCLSLFVVTGPRGGWGSGGPSPWLDHVLGKLFVGFWAIYVVLIFVFGNAFVFAVGLCLFLNIVCL
jgi:hypothetical protein